MSKSFGLIAIVVLMLVGLALMASMANSAALANTAQAAVEASRAAQIASAGQAASSVTIAVLVALLVVVIGVSGYAVVRLWLRLRKVEAEAANSKSQGGPWAPGPNAGFQRLGQVDPMQMLMLAMVSRMMPPAPPVEQQPTQVQLPSRVGQEDWRW